MCRAEKYGVPLSEKALARPKPGLLRDGMRKAKALQRSDGIASFNLYSDAELAKQNNRAARFGTTPAAAAPVIAMAAPSEEEEAKKARAAKYGLEYQEPDASGARLQALHRTEGLCARQMMLLAGPAVWNKVKWARFEATGRVQGWTRRC